MNLYTTGAVVFEYSHNRSDVYDPLQTVVNVLLVYKGV